ncbi:MAG: hypothetical protein LUE19_03470, partial [Clostridiales bacterium]|nr:hypothetical protein [Clostridiales bacterium]
MKRKNVKRVTALAMTTAMVFSLLPATAFAAGTDTGTGSTDSDVEDTVDTGTGETAVPDAGNYADQIDNSTLDAAYLDYSAGIEAGIYQWYLSEDETYYYLAQTADSSQYAATSANVTNYTYQSMLICVPAGYMMQDEDGNIVMNESAEINGYTTETAPVVYENICYGWNSSTPSFSYEGEENPIDYGYIFVVAGARSRNQGADGKMPTPVVDLKAGVIELKANDDVIPGDKDRIISLGMSGGGQMSSILGASGNMTEYYEYMYEAGVLGVSYDAESDTYTSVYDDSVYGAQTYSAIADIENADIAYAWLWCDTGEYGGNVFTAMGSSGSSELSEFQQELQQLEAQAYVNYLNSLNLVSLEGESLSLTDLRSGSYYDQVVQNLSDSLNAQIDYYGADSVTDRNGSAMDLTGDWCAQNEDGTYSITGTLQYLIATGTVNARNKDVPGFDTFDLSAENNAFGTAEQEAVHYSASVAQVLEDNYDTLSQLEGFDQDAVDAYIEQALTGEDAEYIAYQTNLMNATEILLGNDGLEAVTPAQHWRIRSGAVDEHTSFTISYNLALAANMNENVESVDYAQMWGVGHSSAEGESTGSFVEWVAEIAPAEAASSEGPVTVSIDAATYLDYSAGVEAGVYTWVASDDGSYYFLAAADENGDAIYTESTGRDGSISKTYRGVYTSTEITNVNYQTMLVYIPAEYLIIDEDGNVTGIDHNAKIGDYTADTAPIIYQNHCSGWNSSTPSSCNTEYIEEGMIYVSAGARSRNAADESGDYNTGKAPTPVVDLKAGVIQLRANQDMIPGDTNRIISVGGSGAGQMSSILGASGNMSEYYPYMYESGVLGVSYDEETDTYVSEYADNVYAAQCYCPIADIENADLAYAWMRYDTTVDADGNFTATAGSYAFTEFQLVLQEKMAYAFVDYINSLGLEDADGNALTLVNPREGTYYDAVLQNMSDALNALVAEGEFDPATAYEDSGDWLIQNEDGSWSVTDMAGFLEGTGLTRNKNIPGFDTFWLTAENNAFGYADEDGVHYSASVAKILQDNYEELSQLDGFDDVDVDTYIEEALTGDEAAYIENQTNLMNATEILLGNNGLTAVDPAQYWRTRNGTADQHTSFTIAYNLCLAAESAGLNADYSLVWNMVHGSNEGTSTGTFVEWVKEITTAEETTVGPVTESIDAATYLDYSAGVEAGVYTWVASDDGSYYFLA